MKATFWAGAAALCALGLAGAANAAATVYANDSARDCYIAAKFGDSARTGLDDCDRALVSGLTQHDMAAVLVNRGVIYLDYERFSLAMRDFDDAIKADGHIGEAYTNRGAAFLGLRKFTEARTDIDLGLQMGSEEPQKAYYNRGLADEFLGDEKQAYFDYLKASELDPRWQAPKTELTRFTVRPSSQE